MWRLVLVVVLAVGCGGTEMVSSVPSNADGMYSIAADGQTITVPGGTLWYFEPSTPPHLVESYAVECFTRDGKDLKRAELEFRRSGPADRWAFSRVNWYLGACQ